MALTKDQVVEWLRRTAGVIEKNQEYLNELDAAIGDAEHGISINRGFTKILTQLPGISDKDIGNILKSSGMTLVSSMGGASGVLFGTFFIKAGEKTLGKYELSADELAVALRAGLAGVVERGKAVVGDKTMVDALAPCVDAFECAVKEKSNLAGALQKAAAAAEEGMKATIPLIARKGRASYLGERSIGHQDAGATSVYLIVKTLHEVVS